MATDSISRTRSRIVQSPERIKRVIVTMTTTAIEDKRTVTLHEGKARDLQAKITALFNIEKDIRSCVEQLETSQKELAHLKDQLDGKKIERSELQLKQDVRCHTPLSLTLRLIPSQARPQTTPQRTRKTRARTEACRGQTARVTADHRAPAEGVRGDGTGEEGQRRADGEAEGGG